MSKKTIIGEDGQEYEVKKKGKGKKIIIGIIAFIVAIGIFGNLGSNDDKNASNTSVANSTEKEEKTKPYEITEIKEERDGMAVYITGVLKNNTDKDKSYVQITVPFYDADGNKVGDALDNINNLGAGKTWKFKAMYLGDDKEAQSWNADEIEISGF